jgi:curli biogenesis system outer membrane secretion channel CsgG
MRKLRVLAWALAALAVFALAAPSPAFAQAKRPTVALIDFDYGTIDRWWGNEDIGKGIADLIVDGLVEDGSYRVIERKRLDVIMAEQNFSNSDRADPSAAQVAKIGKALGVKYIILGSITKFGIEDKGMKIGAGGWGGGKFGVGDVGTKKGKATVAIAARMVDTTTGEIMAVAKADGTSSRSGLALGGAANHLGGDFAIGSSNFRETVLGEATEISVKAVVAKLIAAKTRLE